MGIVMLLHTELPCCGDGGAHATHRDLLLREGAPVKAAVGAATDTAAPAPGSGTVSTSSIMLSKSSTWECPPDPPVGSALPLAWLPCDVRCLAAVSAAGVHEAATGCRMGTFEAGCGAAAWGGILVSVCGLPMSASSLSKSSSAAMAPMQLLHCTCHNASGGASGTVQRAERAGVLAVKLRSLCHAWLQQCTFAFYVERRDEAGGGRAGWLTCAPDQWSECAGTPPRRTRW